MKKIYITLLLLFSLILTSSMISLSQTPYKCLIQLKNYEGEGAYIIASLLDKDGNYVQTLQVLGDDPEWYHDLTQWWAHYEPKKYDIDAITGPTLSGGKRVTKTFYIDNQYIDKGYSIRFESAVEGQDYFVDDARVELTSENLSGKKIAGTGYIRYIRLLNQN